MKLQELVDKWEKKSKICNEHINNSKKDSPEELAFISRYATILEMLIDIEEIK